MNFAFPKPKKAGVDFNDAAGHYVVTGSVDNDAIYVNKEYIVTTITELKPFGLNYEMEIESGPLRYFTRTDIPKSRQYLWLFRVYKMPFTIELGKDFARQRDNLKLINFEKLDKIQKEFDKGNCEPVLSDNEYNNRKNKIVEVVKAFSF